MTKGMCSICRSPYAELKNPWQWSQSEDCTPMFNSWETMTIKRFRFLSPALRSVVPRLWLMRANEKARKNRHSIGCWAWTNDFDGPKSSEDQIREKIEHLGGNLESCDRGCRVRCLHTRVQILENLRGRNNFFSRRSLWETARGALGRLQHWVSYLV